MRMCGLSVLVCVALAATGVAVHSGIATEPIVERLWPDSAPGAKGSTDGDTPTVTVYLADKDKANRAAVVICPGGGYGHLAMDHEGHQIAQWLNSLGVSGFILKYRHSRSGAGYGHPVPLQDAQRAIRTVRSRAAEWRVDPNRIGILGFSAGGHLASSAATHFNTRYSEAQGKIDRASCRPDFAVLIYPVITMDDTFTHKGPKRNLLGQNPTPELVEIMSNEKQATAETPPTFLVHTFEDKAVPAENSIHFYLALRRANVPAEMHLYEKGQHGFGLGRQHGAVSTWPARCADWMRLRGLIR